MSKNYSLPDYGEYRLQGKENMMYVAEGAAVVAMIGYFFYRSWIACLCLIPVLFLFLNDKKKELSKRQRQELGIQFKDMILAVAFFGKLAMAYFDYKKHGQFEWAGPVILFACLVLTLTAPLYIWTIVGL